MAKRSVIYNFKERFVRGKLKVKILISGGAGYIGSHIFLKLFADHDIFILDNFSNSCRSVISKLKKFSNKDFVTFDFSTLDKSRLEEAFKKYNFDAVIHLASLKSVSDSLIYPALYYRNNVYGSKIIFEMIKKYNIKNLIFSSSATVYGNPLFLPINEKHPIRGLNFYAKNKISIEELLINDCYFKVDCSVKILRYFNPIGAHKSYIFGDNPKYPTNIMPLIVQVGLGKKDYLDVYGNNYNTHDGTGVRDYIHIMDLVDGHHQALKFDKKGISIFNLGTGTGYSVLDLVKEFEETNKIKIPIKFSNRRNGDVGSVFADPARAKKYLNFKPQMSLKDMCKDSWKFAIKNER